ncbi:uncharacterized protein EV154DRAFT_430866 [Mucor mucedo]|uniref:uncharacterized protein n=1 Tax=Mucor mucedo TaxID=29922 RepID=UPI00221E69FA|nr:uncharacterized protein EV154DRAFT_430866 [Mucor mucedo]KAI7873373.1 hypothetical protein EV154DRAFT_430866 [Mucor mucedo]
MVEAIKIGEEVSKTNGRFYKKPLFRAGRFFVCTVPNRTTATLKPIIERHCEPNTVIRSDGWKGYDFMHPPDVLLEDGTYENNEGRYEDGDYYFRQHQVVNHSKSFGTKDQVRGNHAPGYIHTNVIEGMWVDLKRSIAPCYRNEQYCAEKLLEYLWKKENPSVLEGLNFALKEVVYLSGIAGPSGELKVPEWFTRGENELSPERLRQYEVRQVSRPAA